MADAEFDAPEQPKPAMRRPVAARPAARPTIEATANPTPYPKPRDSFEAAVNEGVRQLTEIEQKRATDVAQILEHNPAKVLSDPEALDAVLVHMQLELETFVPDTTSDKGRRAIASFAHKFSKSKTAIDDAGKELNSSLRAQIDAVDEVRRRIRGKFDEFRDLARKPLDDWEAAQEAKADAIAKIERTIRVPVGPLDTAEDIDGVIRAMSEISIDEDVLGSEDAERLGAERLARIGDLVITLEGVRRREEESAEFARVRAENERLQETARQNAAADLARQQAEADRVANAAAETERQAAAQRQAVAAAEQAERDRSAIAIENARRESDQRIKAGEVKATLDTSRAVFGTLPIGALRDLRAKLAGLDVRQATIGPEYLSIGDLAVGLCTEIDRRISELEEADRRMATLEHRKKINTAARDAIMVAAKATKEQANAIVLAIKEQKIPHVRIDYTENLQ